MAAKVKFDRGAWWVHTHHLGRRVKRRIGTTQTDKRNAEKIAVQINARIALGDFDLDDRAGEKHTTFQELATRWFEIEIELPMQRNLAGCVAPKTARLHEAHLRLRILPVLSDKPVKKLGIADVQSLYDHCLKAEPPISQRTIEMTIGTVGRILSYAETLEMVNTNAVAAWKRARGRRRSSQISPIRRDQALDSAQLQKFLDSARAVSPEWYAFVLFLADTGVRLGEASGASLGQR